MIVLPWFSSNGTFLAWNCFKILLTPPFFETHEQNASSKTICYINLTFFCKRLGQTFTPDQQRHRQIDISHASRAQRGAYLSACQGHCGAIPRASLHFATVCWHRISVFNNLVADCFYIYTQCISLILYSNMRRKIRPQDRTNAAKVQEAKVRFYHFILLTHSNETY